MNTLVTQVMLIPYFIGAFKKNVAISYIESTRFFAINHNLLVFRRFGSPDRGKLAKSPTFYSRFTRTAAIVCEMYLHNVSLNYSLLSDS